MPNPNLKRSHLKAGTGGKREGAGRKTKAEEEAARKFCLSLVNSAQFRATLKQKMDDCTAHPSLMTNVFYYAWGKPRETIDVKQIVPVKIVHQYDDTAPDMKKDPTGA